MLKWHMIRVVTLLPYKGMGQSKQFWLAKHLGSEIRRPEVLLCYDIRMASQMKKKISSLLENQNCSP